MEQNLFQGYEKMPKDKDFDKLWKVMTEQQYDNQFKATLQHRQMDEIRMVEGRTVILGR